MQIAAKDVQVDYSAADGTLFRALGPVTMTVESGTFVALLGPSGCGKSTLIRALAGLEPVSGGELRIDGRGINGPSVKVGVMFQDANLMPWRTVSQNVALPLELRHADLDKRAVAVKRVLEPLGLAEFGDVYPGQLSGGMAQRVALGRVLVQEPEVLLLDEPFGALDALNREKISLDLLRIWAQRRQTVLMVTHDVNEAVLLSDRVFVMSQRPGHIIADIPVDLERPRSPEMIYEASFVAIAREVRSAIDTA